VRAARRGTGWPLTIPSQGALQIIEQLAIQAGLEALREAGATAVVDVPINVSAPLSRDH
jgi:hypothetical protein